MLPDHRTIRIEAHQRRAQAHLDRQAALARRERKLAAGHRPVFARTVVRRRVPVLTVPIAAVRRLAARIRRVRVALRPAADLSGT